jgi:hypothetical protein
MLSTHPLAAIAALSFGAATLNAWAEVPAYTVQPVAEYTTAISLWSASDSGHMVGWRVFNGVVSPFLATAENGIVALPLPPGYNSGTAIDVNNLGVIVGAVDDTGFPFDRGVPAVWTPDGNGGYTCSIPQQFTQMSSPIGALSVDGGMAVAINDDGIIIGWSRYQGFQGGPTTRFFMSGPPIDMRDFGFEAVPRDLSETGILVGDQLKLDLNTGILTDIGRPSTQSFVQLISYAVNDSGEVVAAAGRATSTNDIYLTFIHNDVDGWFPLNPAQLPSRFVGFYDNNNRGDISASGGILFRDENVLVSSYDELLDPSSSNWDTGIGYIANDRSVSTVAVDSNTGSNWLVRLIPNATPCQADLAEPFGSLNFFDISAFIALFGASDPIADITGDGLFNFFDVSGYMDTFSAGCP